MARIELIDVTDSNLKELREINFQLFPSIPNNYFFYISIIDDVNALAKLIYYNNNLAGAVTARLDTSVKKLRRFYILTLGILPPYRRLGLGTMLINQVVNYTKDHGNYDSIFLHVQVNNVAAIQFYSKFAFVTCNTLDNYYARLEPTAAYVLQKNLKKTRNKSKRRQTTDGITGIASNKRLKTKIRSKA